MSKRFYFENEDHYFNTCRKLIREKTFETGDLQNNEVLRKLCTILFQFTRGNIEGFIKKNLREPSNVFTYLIKFNSDSYEELSENITLMLELTIQYKKVLNHNLSIESFPDLVKYCHLPYDNVISFTVWNKEKQDYDTYTYVGEFASLCEELNGCAGIYIFYDRLKNPIYIGKSINLGQRIPSSLREREQQLPVHYVSFSLTKTRSDANLYELYYIAKMKPKLNMDSKEFDELTISLPELQFGELIRIKKPIKQED